jgi:hypothetical protein
MSATRGDRYKAAVLADYELNESQLLLVDEIAAVLDTIDGLAASKVAEIRQQRILLSRLLSQLALPDVGTGEVRPATWASDRARKAAQTRWHGRRDAATS